MKTYNISLTEEQRHELIRLVGKELNDSIAARRLLRDSLNIQGDAVDEVVNEVSRLNDVLSNMYTGILMSKPQHD